MMAGVFLPIIGSRVSNQVHQVGLQGPAHGGEDGRGVEVVLAVVQQIIEEIEYVEPSALG